MNLQEAVQTVIGKYADFNGRARRSEYWFWTLAVILAYLVCLVVSIVISDVLGTLLTVVLFLGALVPTLAVTVRRLHDTGKSWPYILFGLIPFVGGIILLVFEVQDSEPGPNAFGPSPKAVGAGGY